MITNKEIIERLIKRINEELPKEQSLSYQVCPNDKRINFGIFDMLCYDTEEEIISALQGVVKGIQLIKYNYGKRHYA